MKKRSVALVALFTVGIALLTEIPALATYTVSEISFPGGATTFFSPFDGPAQITFSFNDNTSAQPGVDPTRTFNVRLRKDGATIHSQNVTITPGSETTPQTRSFSWPDESVTASTSYEVAVYSGSTLMRRRSFTLKPHLVRIVSISPDPFFPIKVNGYRDTTKITYRLEGSSNPVDIDIFRAAAGGTCCGTQVRHKVLPNVVLGTRQFTWNGTNDSNAKVAVGRYFVRITATAFNGQTQSSAPASVKVALYRRVPRSVVQNGNAFHRRSAVVKLRSNGNCSVVRDNASRDARISCQSARVTVFWRWNLPNSARMKSVSFAMVGVPGFACRSARGFKRPDTWLRSGGLGQSRCRVDKARLSYTFLKQY